MKSFLYTGCGLAMILLVAREAAADQPAPSETSQQKVTSQEAEASGEGAASSGPQKLEEFADDTVVTASYSFDRSDPIRGTTLDQKHILELPHFGDDPYRALRVIPGLTAGELSARFGVRGTAYEDIYARLDGVELFAPFHLLDFEGVFSVLDAENLERIDFIPSAYTSQYGDRFGGVLEMTSSRPRGDAYRLGLSLSNLSVSASGLVGDRYGWLVSGRRGFIDQLISVADAADPDGDGDDSDDDESDGSISPRYWDSFARFDMQITDRQSLVGGALISDDALDLDDREDDEILKIATGYGNENIWLSHESAAGPLGYVATTLSRTRATRRRDIEVEDTDDFFELDDDRDMTATNLRQEWTLGIGKSHLLSAGFEARRFESRADYANTIGFKEVIRDPRFIQESRDFTRLVVNADSDILSAWASDRIKIGERLTLEAGLRYDQQSRDVRVEGAPAAKLPRDDQVSPRLNAVIDLGRAGQARVGWGFFFQAQRPNELAVEFGSTETHEAEKQEHFTLGWSRQLSPGLSVRADAYLKRSDNPRPRYEALFSQNDAFSELREDLMLVRPNQFEASGLEIFVDGRLSRTLGFSAGYAYSKAEETVPTATGVITRPRYDDQTHALNLNLVYRPNEKWTFSAVWHYHTGWPTTAFEATVDLPLGVDTEALDLADLDFAIGPFYGDRLPDYHRLDFRVTRSLLTRRGVLNFYIDVQDLYDRDNPKGLETGEPEYTLIGGRRYQVTFPVETQLGLLPSFGVTWKF